MKYQHLKQSHDQCDVHIKIKEKDPDRKQETKYF